MKLNPDALRELEMNHSLGIPKAATDKAWMDFDYSLPTVPEVPAKKVVLTLRPYTARTKYNWDPIHERKIKVDKDTWRGEKAALRYRVTKRANNMASSSGQGIGIGTSGISISGCGISGLDLMKPFTREFWDFKGRKRRARTLEVLKTYGFSQPFPLIPSSGLSEN